MFDEFEIRQHRKKCYSEVANVGNEEWQQHPLKVAAALFLKGRLDRGQFRRAIEEHEQAQVEALAEDYDDQDEDREEG
jgi:hypothetical protein